MNALLTPYRLNSGLLLKNRIVMAPMTRCFATKDLVPTQEIAAYYERRADAGLIITEGTLISPAAQGYPNTPGIYNQEQIQGWREVTTGVKAKGGAIFLQLWHVGRVSHPIYHKGALPPAPSAVKLEGKVSRTDLMYEMPRAMENAEVYATIADYGTAAINAMEAGFDGVEIHGANGYLVDQFMRQHTNKREDEFGKDRTLFAKKVIEAVRTAVGPQKCAIRLSPGAHLNQTHTAGDEEVYAEVLKFCEGLAYVHTGIFNDSVQYEYLQGTATQFIRRNFSGTVMGCGSYSFPHAEACVAGGEFDLLGVGRLFISNWDLVEKVRLGKELLPYSPTMLASLI